MMPPISEAERLFAIFESRLKLASQRQATWAAELEELREFLAARDDCDRHPYTLPTEALDALKKLACWRPAPSGHPAECPSEGYMYRISSIRSVVWAFEWNPDLAPRLSDDTVLWSVLLEHARASGGWVSLDALGSGAYCTKRGFTWWTSLAGIEDDLILAAHRLGIPDNFIFEHSVVLRVPAGVMRELSAARVPTVLDAVDLPIFYPTREADRPRSGVTINVANTPNLAEGETEYAVGPLPACSIEVLPILVDRQAWRAFRGSSRTDGTAPTRRRVPLDEALYEPLVRFYQGLEGVNS